MVLQEATSLSPGSGLPRMLTADGVGAPSTLLGVQVAEAGQAVGEIIPGSEALPRQLLLAGSAHEALLVPGLLPVSDASCGDGLEDTSARVRATPVSGMHLPPLLPVDEVRQPRPLQMSGLLKG